MIYGLGRLALAPKGFERPMHCKRIAGTAGRGRLLKLAAPLAALTVLASGCATEKDIDLASYVETIEPADALYNQGLATLEAGNAGKRYVSLYPSSEDAAYAQYIVGLSYFRQIRDVTQDQKEARRTIEAMDEVISRWPDSQYVEDATAKKRFARDQMAGKEMQIGRYYLERREYIAAAKRFRYVVEVYSDTRHVEEALARLTETYYAMGLASEAQTAAAVLGHNYPDSQWYRDSYKLLQTGGLEPRENKGSWISKAGALLVGT
jgi:outer membrane protein assembly factor BamD